MDCLAKIRQRRIKERLETLRRAITDAEGEGANDRVASLLVEYQALLAEKG